MAANDRLPAPDTRIRRRRWPWWLALGLILAVVAADVAARFIVAARIASEITTRVDDTAGLKVDVGGLVMTPQLLSGRLDSLHLTADSITRDQLTVVDVLADATHVSIRPNVVAGSVSLTMTVPVETIQAQVAQQQWASGVDVGLEGGQLVAAVPVLGIRIDVAVALKPDGRAIVADPASVSIGSVTLPLGGLLDAFLGGFTTMRFDVPLPTGMSLTSVDVTPGGVRIVATGSQVALG